MEQRLNISVLYSGCISMAAAVVRAASNQGFLARSFTLDEWFGSDCVEHTDVLVVDLEAVENCFVGECLADSGIPLLGIRAKNDSQASPGFCINCIDWPRQEELLVKRLLQLAGLDRPIPIRLPSHELSSELAPLNILGQSEAFLSVFRLIKRFAFSCAPILIEGQTGTGKELAARALHYFGSRREKPFIPVNCGAYPDGLFENELFGHQRGAFTDAKSDQPGLIAQAEGGTLFLDEIDSLSTKAQVALLRYLQDQEYRPLGCSEIRRSHVAIISATNADLNGLVRENTFRQDLLYRLNVVNLTLPALRERAADIPMLARHFLRYFSELYQTPPKYFEPRSLERLKAMEWAGNIRELENFVHRAFLLSEGSVVRTQWTGSYQDHVTKSLVTLDETAVSHGYNAIRVAVVNDFERQYLHHLMTHTQGNVSQAARIADKERRSLGKLLKKHGIDRRAYQYRDAS